MLPIAGGTFHMGSNLGYSDEWPVHQVTVRDFRLCKYPVTQAQWQAVIDYDPPKLTFKGCDDCPVEGVSWNDVEDFIQRLNQLTGMGYRLPTEAEWEYAAKGGLYMQGYTYAGDGDPDQVAWHEENSNDKTHPVGGLKANELGLHNMSGNVWEWCQDTWHNDYQGAPSDGSAWISEGDKGPRVVRGGSWNDDPIFCRSTVRNGYGAGYRDFTIGFRLAR